MGRVHLFELHELPWFPAVWRDLLTDFLSFYATAFKPYKAAAPLLAAGLKRAGTSRVVDLCSGAGRPLLSLLPELRRLGVEELLVTLTDKYPNIAVVDRNGRLGAGVTYLVDPVDATDVRAGLKGFRTLFTSFHHFRPEEARAVLADAIDRHEGIGIFEYTERNWLIWALPTLLIPFFVCLCTPLIRPMTWRRFLWTYLIPVLPFVALWDGFVSNLRTYSVAEIQKLVASLDCPGAEWTIGRAPSVGGSRVTYAIGVPEVVSSNA